MRQEVLPREHRPERLAEAVYAHCRTRQGEPPAAKRGERLVRSALRIYEDQLQEQALARLGVAGLAQLESLLTLPDESGEEAEAPPPSPRDERH